MRESKRKKTSAVFIQLADEEESDWWKSFFEKLGNGIFPYRLSYINGSLSYPKNGKFIQLLVENRELEELREEIKNYIRKVVGMIPDDDVEDYSTVSSYTEITWAVIKKDNILREILFSQYIASLKLSKEEQHDLKSEIWWSFLKKELTAANFTIENRQITNYYPPVNKKEVKVKREEPGIITKITPQKWGKSPSVRPPTKLQVLYQLNKTGFKDSSED